MGNKVGLVKYPVEQCGLDVNDLENRGLSPLHAAMSFPHSDFSLLLLDLGADASQPDQNNWRPLHYACFRGVTVDVVRQLISRGASPNVVTSDGKTPLALAVEYRHCELAALLGEASLRGKKYTVNLTSLLQIFCTWLKKIKKNVLVILFR